MRDKKKTDFMVGGKLVRISAGKGSAEHLEAQAKAKKEGLNLCDNISDRERNRRMNAAEQEMRRAERGERL